jgi:uncharacterized protein (DUF1697 family)
MPHYVAFLRGINLGKRRVKMECLRTLFDELGFDRVGTFIASGNVLFESETSDDVKLAQTIERHLKKSLSYDVDTFVRTCNEIADIATAQPFPKADLTNPANTIHVGFLKEPFTMGNSRKLMACRSAVDEFCVDGREFYWLCRIKSHE